MSATTSDATYSRQCIHREGLLVYHDDFRELLLLLQILLGFHDDLIAPIPLELPQLLHALGGFSRCW